MSWGDQGPELTEEYLEDIADWVAESLEKAILRELARPRDTFDPGFLAERGPKLADA